MAFETSTGAGNHADLASKSFLHDCLPDNYVQIATSTASQTFDLRGLVGVDRVGGTVTKDLGGKRVWVQMLTQSGSIMRGSFTITAGVGLALLTTDNPLRSFWVDPGVSVENRVTFIAAGVGTIRFYYCSDL